MKRPSLIALVLLAGLTASATGCRSYDADREEDVDQPRNVWLPGTGDDDDDDEARERRRRGRDVGGFPSREESRRADDRSREDVVRPIEHPSDFR